MKICPYCGQKFEYRKDVPEITFVILESNAKREKETLGDLRAFYEVKGYKNVLPATLKEWRSYEEITRILTKGHPDFIAVDHGSGRKTRYRFVEIKRNSGLSLDQIKWIMSNYNSFPIDVVYIVPKGSRKPRAAKELSMVVSRINRTEWWNILDYLNESGGKWYG